MPERLVRASGTLTYRTPAGVLALSRDGHEPHLLEGTAAVLWDLLDDPISAPALVRTLAAMFGVDLATASSAVETVVGELVDLGLVHRAG